MFVKAAAIASPPVLRQSSLWKAGVELVFHHPRPSNSKAGEFGAMHQVKKAGASGTASVRAGGDVF